MPGHRRLVPIGSARSNSRYFVNESGQVRSTALKKTDSRAVDGATLAQHIARAGFIATTPDQRSWATSLTAVGSAL
jgi:hypothetical protein